MHSNALVRHVEFCTFLHPFVLENRKKELAFIRFSCIRASPVKFFENKTCFTANIYLFKVNNRNTRKRCETCSKLTIKTPERCHSSRSVVFIVNFDHISHLLLLLLLLNLNKYILVGFFLCILCPIVPSSTCKSSLGNLYIPHIQS